MDASQALIAVILTLFGGLLICCMIPEDVQKKYEKAKKKFPWTRCGKCGRFTPKRYLTHIKLTDEQLCKNCVGVIRVYLGIGPDDDLNKKLAENNK